MAFLLRTFGCTALVMIEVEFYLFNAFLIVMLVTISDTVCHSKWNSGGAKFKNSINFQFSIYAISTSATYLVFFDCRASNGVFRL